MKISRFVSMFLSVAMVFGISAPMVFASAVGSLEFSLNRFEWDYQVYEDEVTLKFEVPEQVSIEESDYDSDYCEVQEESEQLLQLLCKWQKRSAKDMTLGITLGMEAPERFEGVATWSFDSKNYTNGNGGKEFTYLVPGSEEALKMLDVESKKIEEVASEDIEIDEIQDSTGIFQSMTTVIIVVVVFISIFLFSFITGRRK
jgi:hypothetical protein